MISKSIRPRRAEAISARRGGMLSRSLKTGTTTARSVIAIPGLVRSGAALSPKPATAGCPGRGFRSDPPDGLWRRPFDGSAPAPLHGIHGLAARALLGHHHECAPTEGNLTTLPAIALEIAGFGVHL